MERKKREERYLMYEKTATAKMSSKEWLRLRKTGIGGSDAGTVCGLNPYSSPIKD